MMLLVRNQKAGHVLNTKSGRQSAPRDQYLVCGYPSNHVGVVGYLLGKGPDLLPYKYKGVRPIENTPNTFQSNQLPYLLFLP